MKYKILCLSALLFIGANGCSSQNSVDVEKNIEQAEVPIDICP